MEVKVKVEDNDILAYLDRIPQNCESILDEEMGKFMDNLKTQTQSYHPWITRTGRLEQSHTYQRLAPMHWEFTVNPIKEGADVDYGAFLEFNLLNYSRSYTWVNPQYRMLFPQLISDIKDRTGNIGLFGKIKKFFGKLF